MTLSPVALAARDLRRTLSLAHPLDLDLEIVLHHRGALVSSGATFGSRACLTRVGARAIVTVDAGLHLEERRFSLAHELGHCVLHPQVSSHALCFGGALDRPESHDLVEREANEFSAEWLMPPDVVAAHCDGAPPSWDRIRVLASAARVSLPAAAIRAVELSSFPAALVFSKNGRQLWPKRSASFGRWIKRRNDRALHPRSLASIWFEERIEINEPTCVPASTWVSGGTKSEELVEHAVVNRRYGSVLSLLTPA